MKPMDDRKRETAPGSKKQGPLRAPRREPTRDAGKATLGRKPKKRMLL
jgi:hypothetical protein